VKRFFSNDPSSPWLRALIYATATLVFGLSVFSASPALHGWLHSHQTSASVIQVGGESKPGSGDHHDSAALPSDDACAIVMFAQGVISIAVAAVLSVLAWRVVGWVRVWAAEQCIPPLRYRLPPLCGPPLS
jgi:hypothetical protein